MMTEKKYTGLEVAVIGMACRFPGAETIETFWQNLTGKKESVQFFEKKELEEMGVEQKVFELPNYVGAGAYLEGKEKFDASFFGFRTEEAILMDPQLRFLHECGWEALENAGVRTDTGKNNIGVYVGVGDNANWRAYSMLSNTSSVDGQTLSHITNKDYAATLLSYRLDLRGPSFNIHTACSTSLVAIHQACRSLLLGECTTALSGGVTLYTQPKSGYLYDPQGIFSNDGHCRAFSNDASGTIFGEGVGMVVLKKLKDAINDNDNIYAVIRGSAINNDGNRKVGFMAPSVDGQIDCMKMALKMSKTEPDTVSYIETHGTGTILGDGIELKSIKNAYEGGNFLIGSVKTNIGHLDVAAGVAGLIKTCLSLNNNQIVPSINFSEPHPEIQNATSVNVATEVIGYDRSPKRAAVSAFGIGGTNAHVVLEEAPLAISGEEKPYYLLPFSAKTNRSLVAYRQKISEWAASTDANLADISYTLITGRNEMYSREYVVVKNDIDWKTSVNKWSEENQLVSKLTDPKLVFLYPGLGTQQLGMISDIYKTYPLFKNIVDEVLISIQSITGDHYLWVFEGENNTSVDINELSHMHLLIFAAEYSLTKLLQKLGVKPDTLIGHSMGEYVCAAISGILSLEDAIRLLEARGKLMAGQNTGRMLAVNCSEETILPFLSDKVSLASVNAPDNVTVSGEEKYIEELKQTLESQGIQFSQLKIETACHSYMMQPLASPFKAVLDTVTFHDNSIEIVSTLTGKKAEGKDLKSPDYWINHLIQPVSFSTAIATVCENQEVLFVEVGAGNVLSTLVQQQGLDRSTYRSVHLSQNFKRNGNDLEHFLNALGTIWENRKEVNLSVLFEDEKRYKTPLPTYAFSHRNYPSEVDPSKLLQGGELNAPTWEMTPDERDIQFAEDWRGTVKTIYKEPVTETEKTIVAEWERFFGRTGIGVSDYFFDLDGDSLKGMTMMANLEKIFNVKLSIRDFLSEPTIENVAMKIDNILWFSKQGEVNTSDKNEMIL
jgi:acyl transferase domain-containing protein/acyl carrier protein